MPFNNLISKYDWQNFVTVFFISVFIFINLIGVIDKKFFTFHTLISDK